MAEADELCDRIAIVDHGRILAIGTPDELKKRVQRESIFRLEVDHLDGGAASLARLPGVVSAALAAESDPEAQRVVVNLVLEEDGAAGRRRQRAGRPRVADPRPAQVRAHARGRVRRARRPRLQRRGGRCGAGAGRGVSAVEAARSGRRVARANPSSRHSRGGTDPRNPSDWTRRQVVANNARSLVGRAYPRVRGMVREPSWLFFEIPLPFLTTSAFVFVYRALQAPEAYIGFVVLGGALSAFWLNVVWMMAGQLYWEKSQGNLELYFAAPMNLMAILLGWPSAG